MGLRNRTEMAVLVGCTMVGTGLEWGIKMGRNMQILDDEEGGASGIDGGLDVGVKVRDASKMTEAEF